MKSLPLNKMISVIADNLAQSRAQKDASGDVTQYHKDYLRVCMVPQCVWDAMLPLFSPWLEQRYSAHGAPIPSKKEKVFYFST